MRILATTAVACALLVGCGSETPAPAPTPAAPDVAPGPEVTAEPVPEGPAPALLMVQAHFKFEGGKPVPLPAKLVIWRTDGSRWWDEVIEDPESNVFHKAVPWHDGILTIGAMGAKLRYWTPGASGWTADTLWERTWGGSFDRLRDLEVDDVDGDGQGEIVIATHDQGVVAVGDEVDGEWTFEEMDQTPDIFVHEIEIGDVDGDGTTEFYATPSARNRATMESQPGDVVRYDFRDGSYVRTVVAHWDESHAKEILVIGLTEEGPETLYAVREAHTKKEGRSVEILDPVKIVRLDPAEDGTWTQTVVATLDDQQCRFLVPGDVDGDGQLELIAAGYKSGLWLLEVQEDGSLSPTLIDADSGGYEHATHVADLDGDGTVEIYVAADTQRQLRSYRWNGTDFDREVIAELPDSHITWNLQDARL